MAFLKNKKKTNKHIVMIYVIIGDNHLLTVTDGATHGLHPILCYILYYIIYIYMFCFIFLHHIWIDQKGL